MKSFTLTVIGISLFLATAASAQVKIPLPATRYKLHEEIHATVENIGNNPVTLCVEFGQTSSREGNRESTPSPFWVQNYNDGK